MFIKPRKKPENIYRKNTGISKYIKAARRRTVLLFIKLSAMGTPKNSFSFSGNPVPVPFLKGEGNVRASELITTAQTSHSFQRSRNHNAAQAALNS